VEVLLLLAEDQVRLADDPDHDVGVVDDGDRAVVGLREQVDRGARLVIGLDGGDVQLTTAVTAGGGLYSFIGLAPGNYIVGVNQTNFTDVNNTFGPGAFPQAPMHDAAGRVTYGLFEKAAPPRQFQLGARLNF